MSRSVGPFMRLSRFPAPALAVVLSFLAEGLVCLITRLFGIVGYRHFSALQDFWYQLSLRFYIPGAIFAERLTEAHFISHDVGMDLMIFIAVLQWWLIFLAAIWIFRHFRGRHERSA